MIEGSKAEFQTKPQSGQRVIASRPHAVRLASASLRCLRFMNTGTRGRESKTTAFPDLQTGQEIGDSPGVSFWFVPETTIPSRQ